MTRFSATTAEERQALVADAVDAHRRRGSPYLTVEADEPPPAGEVPAWVQYRVADGRLNIDCLPDEFDRLTSYLDAYPAVTIVERSELAEAEGINVRLEAYGDDDRLATIIEGFFEAVYGYDADYRLWVSEV